MTEDVYTSPEGMGFVLERLDPTVGVVDQVGREASDGGRSARRHRKRSVHETRREEVQRMDAELNYEQIPAGG